MENEEHELTEDDLALMEAELAKSGGEYGFPKPESKESVFRFFRHIIELADSSKVGNLSMDELGMPAYSVRGLQSLANYAGVEKLSDVQKYLLGEAQITLATSTSLKGFLLQLFVTQIKKQQTFAPPEQKKGWFSSKPSTSGERGAALGGA